MLNHESLDEFYDDLHYSLAKLYCRLGDHTKTEKVLRRLNVPILHGIHLSSLTVDEWKKSQRGVPPIETVTSVILPELDGRNEPIVTHAPLRKNIGGVEVSEYVAIEERVSRLASRAINWIKLRRKENFKKWLSLQKPYKDVVNQLPKLKESFRDFIIA